jgi:pilus assembly protein Flp/PilA
MLNSMINYLRVKLSNKKGQGMVEYGLIIGLIAVLVIGAFALFRTQLVALFNNITDILTGANTTITTGG